MRSVRIQLVEIDVTGWPDLNERLDALQMSSGDRDVLIQHLTARLVGHFGADVLESFPGKNDPESPCDA